MARIEDVIAVGAGPANLSLAALAEPVPALRVAVLERSSEVTWHPGMMLPDAVLQVSPLKDLVTLVDPTSPYSFLNFLRERRRIYRALVAHRGGVSRREFEQYYRWVAARLDSVRLGHDVASVDHDGESFVVRGSFPTRRASNIVVGVGQAPYLPPCAEPFRSGRVLHSSEYLARRGDLSGTDVVVVGGGQSAAEIVHDIIRDTARLPRRLTWLGGRRSFSPLDDSPFANELFTPRYVRYFAGLPAEQRMRLLSEQVLASDGISAPLIQRIYERLYELDYVDTDHAFTHRLVAGGRLERLAAAGQGYRAAVRVRGEPELMELPADVVVLATGYRPGVPDFLAPLRDRIDTDGGTYRAGADYGVAWDGPAEHRIYVQNASRATHGVADPNLSLAAWRSAVIINSIARAEVYPIEDVDVALSLPAPETPAAARNGVPRGDFHVV
jgi:lysine N6-hydroxylase